MDPITASVLIGAGAGLKWGIDRLRDFDTEKQSLESKLIWDIAADEGIIRQKDGSLLAAWEYRGADMESATEAEVNALGKHINRSLTAFGDGWNLSFNAIRSPVSEYIDASDFGNPVAQVIDEDRRERFASGERQMETRCFFACSYLPPSKTRRRIEEHLIKNARSGEKSWERVLRKFKNELPLIEGRFSKHLTMNRLDTPALLSYLHECVTGLRQKVHTRPGAFLSHSLCTKKLSAGFNPTIGNQHLRLITIRGFPEEGHTGTGDFLKDLDFPYRWSTRWIPLSMHTADKEIKDLRETQKGKAEGGIPEAIAQYLRNEKEGKETEKDLHAQAMYEELGEALAENRSGKMRQGYFTSTLVIYCQDPAKADERAEDVLEALSDKGFTGHRERFNALEAYVGTLPGHGDANLRRPLMPSGSVKNIIPLTAPNAGPKTNPSHRFPPNSPPLLYARARAKTPFRMVLGSDDIKHTMIIGGTGGGKSVLVGLIVAQWLRFAGSKVFLFDVGRTHEVLVKALGGNHYDITSSESPALQPLRFLETAEDREWAINWIRSLYAHQNVELTPSESSQISEAIKTLSERPPEERMIFDLINGVGTPHLRTALEPYATGGRYAHLFDGDEDIIGEGRVHCFEIQDLVEMPPDALLPMLLLLFKRVEREMDGSPVLIPIEEAHAGIKHPAFAKKLKQWLLTLRKKNAGVMPIMHSPAQLQKDGDITGAEMIIDSCKARIFLPSSEANATEKSIRSYEKFGLSRAEIDLIADPSSGTTNRGDIMQRPYLYHSRDGSRLISLDLEDSVALSFIGTPKGETQASLSAKMEAMQAKHGDAWPAEWLQDAGHEKWAKHLRTKLTTHEPIL